MPLELPRLPVSDVLEDIGVALAEHKTAILSAPPGAGKTTIVPLFLLDAKWRADGRIILLEPRRLAARAAARRMAEIMGEEVGVTVGYRMRLDSRVSAKTRIEVVTEGVFARMILDDPELKGVAAVIFDEFHERSLDGDFGLALALDCRSALREDLRILVMSATLDVGRVSALMENPTVIESSGRAFGVDIRYQNRKSDERIEDAMASAIINAVKLEEGSVLAFLPGQSEILRTAERLEGRFGPDVMIAPLFGNLPQAAQDAAIRPAPGGTRKVVLATSIAETSITIDGVRIVIDSGLQRLPVYEAATGITRLETLRVSRASAEQRTGRAGRTAPGIAIRLWHAGQTASLAEFTPPQILATDLSSFLLDLACWGVTDPSSMKFIDLPPAASLAEARSLLQSLGGLDERGGLTRTGRVMRNLALPPRLASMVIAAAASDHHHEAAQLAVLLTEQGLGGNSIDLEERMSRFRNDRGERAAQARKLAGRMAGSVSKNTGRSGGFSIGAALLHAFPDRVGLQRGGRGRFVMANGRGAEIAPNERLAGCDMVVIADLTGRAGGQRVLAAAETSRAEVEGELPLSFRQDDELYLDDESGQVRARRINRLGTIVLDERPLPRPKGGPASEVIADAIRRNGAARLPFSKAGDQLRDRLAFLHKKLGNPWPAVDDVALGRQLDLWFLPFQGDISGFGDITPQSLADGLMALVPQDLARQFGQFAPTHFTAPTGQRHAIRYDGDEPVLAIRVQELFGLNSHPRIGGGKIELVLELLSPGHRPIQTTRNLPGFWAGSWKDVRAEMRGRYPRHPWPEDPASAQPTTRAKPRGT